MPENRKFFPHNAVLFCTTRTEVDLPFTATHSMNFILWGILAKAHQLYPVKVCHFIFLANHLHMLLVVDDPEDVSRFIGYVKAESAHAVNLLLGRIQRTIWKDGYDSPIVLTADDAMKCIRYIYLNPSKPSLVASIDKYPGLSSWELYRSDERSKVCKRLHRPAITRLPSPALSINEQKRLVRLYEKQAKTRHTFTLEPDAWVACFPELKGVPPKELNERLVRDIRLAEAEYALERKRNKRDVIGSTALRRESMAKDYTPDSHGRKSICLCFDKAYRRAFINTYRVLCAIAEQVYHRWHTGDTSARMPPGMCAPNMPRLASAIAVPA